MNDHATTSTLRRPPTRLLQQARLDRQMHADTIKLYLENGWSLALCCCGCERIVEWTPPALAERFTGKLHVTIADLVDRVACTGEGGCGSKDIALFPHPYDHPWRWPPAGG